MEIPVNNYNPQKDIDELTEKLINDLNRGGGNFGAVVCKDASFPLVIEPILKSFKEKGWFTYYYERFDGVILEIQIYKSHYSPRGGRNRLVEY